VHGVNINRHEKTAPGMTKGGDASTGPGEWGLQRGPVELPAQGKAGCPPNRNSRIDCAAVPPGLIERRERKRAARSRPESSSPRWTPIPHEQEYDTGVSGETVNESARLSASDSVDKSLQCAAPWDAAVAGREAQTPHFMAPRRARAERLKRSAAISNKPLTTCASI
jgi:hypothetical protein